MDGISPSERWDGDLFVIVRWQVGLLSGFPDHLSGADTRQDGVHDSRPWGALPARSQPGYSDLGHRTTP